MKSIKFRSGTAGAKYKHFNGKITKLRVVLNKDAFIDDEHVLVGHLKEDYGTPSDVVLEYKEENIEDKITSDKFVEDPHKEWDYDGYREYSVSLWFRYLRHTEKKKMVIFRLTSNEKQYLEDKTHHGDRVLSLF